jgi:excinuclease UvrABC nuclease subunit
MDTVSGVSPEHRNRLIRFYKSVDAIAQGDAEEVAKVGRMPLALAKKLLEKLQKPEE